MPVTFDATVRITVVNSEIGAGVTVWYACRSAWIVVGETLSEDAIARTDMPFAAR